MPPKRKKEAPATRRSSRSPAAGKPATSPKPHKAASAAKKANVELLAPSIRVVSFKNAKPADGKVKPEDGKVAGASATRNRGRVANGKEKGSDEVASPEPKRQKVGKKRVIEEVGEDKGSPVSMTTASGQLTRTIIIEACTQCRSFKERADKVKRGLESAIPGISVEINPQKPRRGYFEIREEKTEVILSLPSMNRPFALMKQLNMDEVVEELINRCNK